MGEILHFKPLSVTIKVSSNHGGTRMLLGSHVSMKGKTMLLGSAEDAVQFGANAFMIYTGAPQITRHKPIEELNIDVAKAYMADQQLGPIVVHVT